MQELNPIKTGYEELDEFIGGFYPGEVTVIASRTGVGKSLFLQSIIERTILSLGTPSLFFSIDKPADMIYDYFVSMISGISYLKIRHVGDMKLEEEEVASVEILQKQVRDLPLIINDNRNLTINDICYESRHAYKVKAIKIIYIDYLSLIKTENEYEKQPYYEQYSRNIRKVKALAQELNIPIVVNCLMYRNASYKEPVLQELLGSPVIEQVADNILILHRKPLKEYHWLYPMTLIVGKNGHGDLGSIDMMFSYKSLSFETSFVTPP